MAFAFDPARLVVGAAVQQSANRTARTNLVDLVPPTPPPPGPRRYGCRRCRAVFESHDERQVDVHDDVERLAEMVRQKRQFKVVDAKTGEDLTRGVLAQIIMEEEARGTNMLPVNFLRQLISMYGDQIQSMVPQYLEASLDQLQRNQSQLRETMAGAFAANPFAEMAQHDCLRRRRVDGRPVDGVAVRRVAAICPIEHPPRFIDLEIDRLRQTVEEQRDVSPCHGRLARRRVDACAIDPALAGVVRPLLRPVEVPPDGVDCNADTPPCLIAAVVIAVAGLHEDLDVRSVQIRPHDAHPFAITPVKLLVPPIECELLGCERASFWHDQPAIAAVKVGALDRSIISARHVAHVRPVNVSGFGIHGDAIRMPAAGHEGFRA